ncbi:Holliday junction endonuclease RuvC [Treponema bryantii]|uniref:Crossover junction endodeoxyribonuclease RuvC n=2 Tax=Treponema bryantii TaxID=163 RepID=A0A1H9A5I3_9SPIR|nr:Holliday junction endonuclease RuvC [Treponema bryantii]
MSDNSFMSEKFSSLPGSEKAEDCLSSHNAAVSGVNGASSSKGPGTRERRRIRRVLGIDPGLANTGFGVVDFYDGRYRMVSYGCITTKADQPHGERLLTIYSRLCAVIDEFQPDEAGMETLYFARNVTSALSVAEARGVVTLCLAQHNIKLGEYQPNQIKQAVTGTAAADKELVERYVKILLGLKTEPKPDHAADALAGAITHLHYSAGMTNL